MEGLSNNYFSSPKFIFGVTSVGLIISLLSYLYEGQLRTNRSENNSYSLYGL
jgi:hypothetical protein